MTIIRKGLRCMGNDNSILDEYVEREYADTRLDDLRMEEKEFNLIQNTYGKKGRVLCIPSPYNKNYEDKSIFKDHSIFNYKSIDYGHYRSSSTYFNTVIDSLMSEDGNVALIPNPYLKNSFLVDSVLRMMAEYNPQYWQLVVCGVILCNDGIVLLRNNEKHPRLPNKVTMIQGHVDGRKEMHLTTSKAFFTNEFVREVTEELVIPGFDHSELYKETFIAAALQINQDEVGMDHLGIFCVTDLRRNNISAYNISSNEESHEVVVYQNSEEIRAEENIDSWLEPIASLTLDKLK